MMTVAVIAALVGYGRWLHRARGWPGGTVLLPLFSTTILVLYVSALFHLLRPSAYVLVGAGCALMLWQGARLARDHRRWPDSSVVGFIAVIGFLAWRLHGAAFMGWDEFSHWGIVSKEVITTHALIASDSPVIFKDYPPGTALFHYIATIGSAFNESSVYLAHAVLALSALAALCSGRGWLSAAATYVFGYFTLFTFADRGFQALDVDHIVGLFFGCGLGAYFLAEDRDRVLRLIPVVAVLPLLKSVGLMLAVLAALAVTCDQLVISKKANRAAWLTLALLVCAPLATNYGWKMRARAVDPHQTFPLAMTASDIREAFSDAASPRARTTIAAFEAALHAQPIGPEHLGGALAALRSGNGGGTPWRGLTCVGWGYVYLSLVAILACAAANRDSLVRLVLCHLWVALGIAGYLFGLLLLYLFSFGEGEGVRLASFPRYVGIIGLGVFTVVFAWALAFATAPGGGRPVAISVAVLMTFGAFYTAPSQAIRFAREGAVGLSSDRVAVQRAVTPALTSLARDARVYVVWEGSNGLEFYLSRYELTPRRTNTGCWSLGASRFQGDVWTCPMQISEWERALQHFDHVVLGQVDDRFWQEYGALFKGRRDGRLFDVHTDAGVYLAAH